jgi:hypothetical protein
MPMDRRAESPNQLSHLEIPMRNKHFWVWLDGEWTKCKNARETTDGCLEYELTKKRTGLAPLGKWMFGNIYAVQACEAFNLDPKA